MLLHNRNGHYKQCIRFVKEHESVLAGGGVVDLLRELSDECAWEILRSWLDSPPLNLENVHQFRVKLLRWGLTRLSFRKEVCSLTISVYSFS